MALGGSRPLISLSERFLRGRSSSESDSESTETLTQDDQSPANWPTHPAALPSTFVDDGSEDESDTASMTSSTWTDRLPDLTRSNSIASLESSAMQTDIASVMQNGYVLESDDGILTLPHTHHEPHSDLLCPFQILDCELTFSSIRQFKIHVFSHFRGHPLPPTALCFLCEAKFEQTPEDDSALAWNNMLGHMAHEHYRRGQEFGVIRADFGLMRWMYDRKIISDHYFKRAQVCPAPTLLPNAASRRASEVISRSPTIPEAPTPPSPSSPTSITSESPVSPRRLSVYGNQAIVTFAGPRAERRRRDSTRLMARRTSMISQS